MRALLTSQKRFGGAGNIALRRFYDLIFRANVALARNGRHHRVSQMDELLEIAHQVQCLLSSLAKTGARINANAIVVNARLFKHVRLIAQIIAHFRDNIVVHRALLHSRWLIAFHMHDNQTCIAVCSNLNHGRVAKTRNVVDNACARFNARPRNRCMTRINAHANSLFR